MIKFQTSAIELIQKRCSWRTYNNAPIEEHKISLLNEFIANLGSPPFSSQARFHLIQGQTPEAGRIPGTYGVIRGTKNFIAGAVKHNKKHMEDFGYLFEAIILFATDLGLRTCWLGGTFNQSGFAGKIKLQKDEILPAISPIGYAAEKKNMLDTTFAFIASSRKRNPWKDLFFLNDFSQPLDKNKAGQYSPPLEMVRLAPSASNRQPWRIIKDDKSFHFFLQRTRGYTFLWGIDLQRVDMGICMCHFELAAKEIGLAGSWKLIDPPKVTLPPLTEYVASWIVA